MKIRITINRTGKKPVEFKRNLKDDFAAADKWVKAKAAKIAKDSTALKSIEFKVEK